MPRANPLQAAVNAGEFSPRMAARVDFARYEAAGAVVENLLPLAQGGLARRPGTRHVAAARDAEGGVRLLPFQFSTGQAYVIEAGDGYFRFHRHQARLTVAATDAAIANGGFAVGTGGWDDRSGGGSSIAHDAANGRLSLVSSGSTPAWAEQEVAIGGAYEDVEHVLAFTVHGVAGDTVELRVGTTSTGGEIIAGVALGVGTHIHAFTPGVATVYVQFRHARAKTVGIDDVALLSGAPLELATPYGADDLALLACAQSADVLHLAHPDHALRRLERRGHAAWSLVRADIADGPWLDANDTATTLAAGATSGLGVTLTASAAAGINGGRGFAAADIGRAVRLAHGSGEPGWGVITAVASATAATVDVRRAFASTGTTTAWRLGAWSDESGHPRAVAFFEQRLVAAATTAQPQTFWASQSADLENMRPDSYVSSAVAVEDDDALDFTIAADEVNAIVWLSPGRELVLGTVGGEWVVRAQGPVLTPTDIDVKRQTAHGCAPVAPARVGHVVLFVQRARRKVREFVYTLDADGFTAPDLTLLADHVTRSGLVAIAWQQEPDAVLWGLRADGVLAAMTYKREQEVVGWSRHIPGGRLGDGPARVEAIAVIPGDDGDGQAAGSADRDELWLVVARTVDGVTVRHVEVMEGLYAGPAAETYDDAEDWREASLAAQRHMYYADALLTWDGAATDLVEGLDHLEGETVKVLADGAVHPDRVVVDGAIVLQRPASVVQAGLAYRHHFATLKQAAGAAAGTALAKPKRIARLGFVLLETAALRFGPSLAALTEIGFRSVADAMDTAVPLFTGERVEEFPGTWEADPRIHIAGDAPAAFTLLALAPELQTNEQA
ncbi:MAG: hypothetical protein AB7N54_13060 [Alphaproteobacteria bacterium]